MAENCCQFVGNYTLSDLDGCIISLNNNITTEFINTCGEGQLLEGPTIGSLNITGYASDKLWVGCYSRAGVSIPFIRKYDCDNDVIYFIFSGEGQSFYMGDAKNYVTLTKEASTSDRYISISSQSGPATIYTDSLQTNGYGMRYTGLPIPFDTHIFSEDPVDGGKFSIGPFTNCYLQSFSLELQPGQLPVANYTFAYQAKAERR